MSFLGAARAASFFVFEDFVSIGANTLREYGIFHLFSLILIVGDLFSLTFPSERYRILKYV